MSAADLLPPNAQALARLMAEANEYVLGQVAEGLPKLRALWHPAGIEAEWLPRLAWALGIDDWDPDWDEARMRAVVSGAWDLHAYKGTRWAIKQVLSLYGFGTAEVIEFRAATYDGSARYDGRRQYGGGWYRFAVNLDSPDPPSQERVDAILAAIARAQALRSCLVELRQVRNRYDGSLLYDGAADHSDYLLWSPQAGPIAIHYDGAHQYDGAQVYGSGQGAGDDLACATRHYNGLTQYNGATDHAH